MSDPVVEVPLDHLVVERPGVFEVGAPGLLWERELFEPSKELELVPSPMLAYCGACCAHQPPPRYTARPEDLLCAYRSVPAR